MGGNARGVARARRVAPNEKTGELGRPTRRCLNGRRSQRPPAGRTLLRGRQTTLAVDILGCSHWWCAPSLLGPGAAEPGRPTEWCRIDADGSSGLVQICAPMEPTATERVRGMAWMGYGSDNISGLEVSHLPKKNGSIDLHHLARLGAVARLQELEAEAAAIRRAFPSVTARPPDDGDNTLRKKAMNKRRKRKMSPEAREAVRQRMKAYWAKRKRG